MNIQIHQGTPSDLPHADINIVIDVIRAFSVSHYAFLSNVKYIHLVNTIEEALILKDTNQDILLSGEIKGYKIEQFDFGNSPYELASSNLANKVLVQKTTNGVKAVLSSLNANHVIVTGFTNYYATINYINKLSSKNSINIIASHPTGEDDLACAMLLENTLLQTTIDQKREEEKAIAHILNSKAAQKFLDENNMDFSINDLIMCLQPYKNDFVMKVKTYNNMPTITKDSINA